MRNILTFMLALLSPIFASAKTGPEHCKDMLDVLGILQEKAAHPSYQHANEVAKTITAMIDNDVSSLRTSITNIAPNFSLGPSIHRLFFHWGFNEDPRHSKALSDRINAVTTDDNARNQIWGLIKAEQGRRNRAMMAKAAMEFNKNSGLMLSRKEQNALASIMYNVHILGDYEVSGSAQTGGMVSMNAIIADTIRSLGQRLQEPNRELVHEFEQQLNAARGMPESPKKATTILEFMKIYVPKILKDNRRMKSIVYGEI